MIRVQDTELLGADDPAVLEWAAREGRILLTHDWDTMTKFANDRIAQGLPMAGAIFVRDTVPIAKVIEDLLAVLVRAKPANGKIGRISCRFSTAKSSAIYDGLKFSSRWLKYYSGRRGYIPKTRHQVVFEIPLPQSTLSDRLYTDKDALRDHIIAFRAEGLSYREIAQEIGLHWTRVGQVLNSTESPSSHNPS